MIGRPAASPRARRAAARRSKRDCNARESECRVAITAAGAAHAGPGPAPAPPGAAMASGSEVAPMVMESSDFTSFTLLDDCQHRAGPELGRFTQDSGSRAMVMPW